MGTAAKNLDGRGRKGSREARHSRPVVVCGGAGFLGAHLCARLLDSGHRVICVDNFCTSDEEAIEHLAGRTGFELQRRDIASLGQEDFGPVSAIYNMACAASPVHYQRRPLETLLTSIRGMDNLLRIARRYQARIFQASTSEVYGHPTIHPQRESYWGHVNPVGPRSCYDEGKRCAETLCFIYQQQYDVPVRIARIFNTYGPGMRLADGRVVINFIVQALADEPLSVYGDGRQTRSFCYVEDLIEGILRMMEPASELTGPINLGNPQEIEIAELARRIIRLTGSRSRVQMGALPIDDPPRRRPDISLAIEALGWQPRTDLDVGLGRTIADVQARLEKGEAGLVREPPSVGERAVAGVNAL
ncbi:MAG TPA: UDP-glucuronic acid decarboxylase family protein [Steroidobacter sp.]